MQCVHFNIWDNSGACATDWVTFSNSRQALSTDWGKHVHKWRCTCAQVPIRYHTHAYITSTLLDVHTLTLAQTYTQPEAEDLRLRSGTWSQSHLGPQILLCSPQSGLILCSTESCSAPPCLPYLPTSVPPNSCGSLLFRFPWIRWAWIRRRCISAMVMEKVLDGRAVTHLIEVKLSRACETKEEGLSKTVKGGWWLL